MGTVGTQRDMPGGGGRRCGGCGTPLAADNNARLCGPCSRDQRDQLRTPPTQLREDFFDTDEFHAAFESEDIGKIFKAYRNHPDHLKTHGTPINQELLSRWLGISQGLISKLESGKKKEEYVPTLRQYAKKLHLPQHLLWFKLEAGQKWTIVPRGPAEYSITSADGTSSTRGDGLLIARDDAAGGIGTQPALREIDRLAAEILDSGTADGAIDQLADVTVSLAESHTQAPARHVLTQVFHLHKQAQVLLGGKQRLSQKRELFRIESDLLAHACLLLDDLKQNEVSQRFGSIALSFAQEAGTSQATARTALAKSLRWAERLIESADMAKIGYECSPATPVRIQLASQEANAAALMGNTTRAQEALRHAEIAAETVSADSGKSAWSFSTGRQAIFALSVALSTGDADAALRAVTMADDNWASGVPVIPANWAQIRVGASIAHLSKGSLDAAISEITPVLEIPPELRISTVTAYMERLDRQLNQARFKGDKDAAELRQTIRDFNSTALLGESSTED